MNKSQDPNTWVPPTESAPHAVELLDLCLSFVDGRRVFPVLENISLAVRPGDIVSIVGPSGCGKTSLLRVIGGLLSPRDKRVHVTGRVSIYGQEPAVAKSSRTFGFAFQNPVLLPWRSVAENIRLPLEIIGSSGGAQEMAIRGLLQLMGIADFANAYPNQLSGGMQQRVNIARTLVHEPRILLLDEPFGALDEMTRERLNAALLDIHRAKRPTIVLVTHSLTEAVYLSDRIIVFSQRPAHIRGTIPNGLGSTRPLDIRTSPQFVETLGRLRAEVSEEGSARK